MSEAPTLSAPALNPWEIMATFSAAVMEVSWVVLLYQAMGPATASDPIWMPFGFFLVIVVLTGVSARVANQMGISKGFERGMLFVILGIGYGLGSNLLLQHVNGNFPELFNQSLSGLGDLAALIPGEVWLAIALIWLILRGYFFGKQGVGRFAVFGFFRLGVVMFLFYGLLSLASGRDLPGLGMFTIFLLATLSALTAARVSFLGRLRGGRRNPFTRQWLGSIAGAVLGTVGMGLTIAMLVVGRLQMLIVFLVGVFITLGFAPLLFLLSLFMNIRFEEITPVPLASAPLPTPNDFVSSVLDRTNQQLEAVPDNLRGYIFIAGIILSIILFVLLLAMAATSVRRMVGNPDVEYVAKRGDLVEMMRKQAGDQLRQPGDWLANRLEKRQRIQAAARIRQIYADLLELCDELDISRSESQTPLEFLPVIQNALPSNMAQLQTITSAYLKVRYGELPETRDEVLAVETAWEKVRQTGELQKQVVLARKRDEERITKLKGRG